MVHATACCQGRLAAERKTPTHYGTCAKEPRVHYIPQRQTSDWTAENTNEATELHDNFIRIWQP